MWRVSNTGHKSRHTNMTLRPSAQNCEPKEGGVFLTKMKWAVAEKDNSNLIHQTCFI